MLCGMELGVVGIIGIILLIGIVKKNAILMIDIAVKAAKEAGVRGGTVCRARDAELGKKIFGITVQPEKEIVFMLVRAEIRQAVMQAICAAVFRETGEHAYTFSLPVSDVVGLHKDKNEESNSEKDEEQK